MLLATPAGLPPTLNLLNYFCTAGAKRPIEHKALFPLLHSTPILITKQTNR
jgi:hypothetical protein